MSAEAPAADGTAVEASSSSTAAAAAVTATPAPAPPPRLENTVACVPVVYGSVAFSLSNKKAAAAASDEINTHQWTLYLRGPNDEDLSPVIERVVFQLHASFARPLREVTTPPYEVTERGWGEFEAQIRITWRDPHEKSTYISHGIKLYPPGTPESGLTASEDTGTPVVAESYDEVVFTDPTETFWDHLRRVGRRSPPLAYSQAEHFPTYADTEDCQALVEADRFLRDQLTAVRTRMETVDADLRDTDERIRQVQERQKAMAASNRTKSSSSTVSGGGGGSTATTPTTTNVKAPSAAATKKN